eukprot:2458475-Rhodomonas_salina.1
MVHRFRASLISFLFRVVQQAQAQGLHCRVRGNANSYTNRTPSRLYDVWNRQGACESLSGVSFPPIGFQDCGKAQLWPTQNDMRREQNKTTKLLVTMLPPDGGSRTGHAYSAQNDSCTEVQDGQILT